MLKNLRRAALLQCKGELPGLKRENQLKLLGQGQTGVVFGFGNVAIKVTELDGGRADWEREVEIHRRFGTWAPKLLCVKHTAKYGVVAMERLVTTLDAMLRHRLKKPVLAALWGQLLACLRYCREKKLTHGDLALFNVGLAEDGRVVLLDFDRASDRVFDHRLDVVRVALELDEVMRSRGSQRVQPNNARFILARMREEYPWLAKLRSPYALDDEWERLYERYMHSL